MTRPQGSGVKATPDPPAEDAAAARARFQIRISRGLLFGFGGLVLLAVVAVLVVGLWSARQNTFDLLRDKSESTIELLLARIEQYLRPAEDQLFHLAKQFESGSIDLAADAEVAKFLSGALAATPQVRSVVLIRDERRMIFALRHNDGVKLQIVDIGKMPVLLDALEDGRAASGLHWGDVARPETSDVTLLNVRYSLHLDGRYVGLLAATVRVDTLSALLESTAKTLGGSAFVLYDKKFLLAHPKLVTGLPGLGADHPLPTIAEVGDPLILAAFVGGEVSPPTSSFEERTGIRILDAGGESVALLSRTIQRYGVHPWLIAVHFPAANISDELERLRWAAIAGGIVLLVSLGFAYAMARYLSKPLVRLAVAAQHIRDLTLDRVHHLPGSVFKEVSSADQAFNSMVSGLRWFETYVPRNLVHRLVRQGDQASTASIAREATVMFTDIVGFTRLSEAMTAPETATFLNAHFAMLGQCVEAEGGTIDKFIGDALMAFWGAPEALPDHAARACRAAIAIRGAVTADNARRRAAGAPPVRVRIGIHTGEVIVGNIGAPGRINYTVVGDTVNAANRVEQLGKEVDQSDTDVTIVLSGATTRAAGAAINPALVGKRQIRGREEEIEIYRL
ncbi:MAG: HAMP domain-containing protein [Alphaproteobacteria bacterium]|nr:HAMP domain-containing protein [Alphaproteobacteria bacterium]